MKMVKLKPSLGFFERSPNGAGIVPKVLDSLSRRLEREDKAYRLTKRLTNKGFFRKPKLGVGARRDGDGKGEGT